MAKRVWQLMTRDALWKFGKLLVQQATKNGGTLHAYEYKGTEENFHEVAYWLSNMTGGRVIYSRNLQNMNLDGNDWKGIERWIKFYLGESLNRSQQLIQLCEYGFNFIKKLRIQDSFDAWKVVAIQHGAEKFIVTGGSIATKDRITTAYTSDKAVVGSHSEEELEGWVCHGFH